jgi:hypothetical protein
VRCAVERTFDVFEKLEDGTLIWKASAEGRDEGVRKLHEVAASSANEFRLIHVPTKALIAITNIPE